MKPKPTSTVSIIVIAYNEAARITDCLTSILNQNTTIAFDVVVVDDGSTDATAALATAVADTDHRVTLVSLGTNQGRGAARAAGIHAATGTHLAFVDADIRLPGNWLETCYRALPGHAAAGGIAVPDGDAAVVTRLSGATVRSQQGSQAITGNNVLFDGEVLRATKFPNTPLGEDFRLACQLEDAGHSLVTVPGLQVAHLEAKTYRKAVKWLFASGVDATRLLAEFGRWRLPDLTGAGFAATVGVAVVGALFGHWWLLGIPVLALLAVWAGHTLTRFAPTPHFGRFLLAATLNLPLISAYLIGRTVSLPLLLKRR